MNFLKLFMLLMIVSTFASCGDDEDVMDDPICVQADWVGSYSGTITCNREAAENLIVAITAADSNKIVVIYDNGSENTYLDLLGCRVSSAGAIGDVSIRTVVTLDGDNLTITTTTNDNSLFCEGTTTRN